MDIENVLPVHEKVVVEFTKDKMFGIIFFEEPENGGRQLSSDEIRRAIKDKGITKGIQEEVLNQIFEKKQYDYKYVIAKGKAPEKGEDAEITYQFDIENLGKLKPKEKADGTVDFKELNTVHNVEKGIMLAVKKSAKEGIPGYTVCGEEIRAQKGKDIRMPRGKNTELSVDGLTLAASVDGQLFYDGHNIYISPTFIVEKDLDSSVGNIDFVGNVVVNGSVHSGFTIKAGGNVEVKGYVEAANIIADGNIILWYGIQGGDKGELIAKGNIITKFIQNAKVFAQKDIITEVIMHSQVAANNKVLVEKGKGMIVGGSVTGGRYISSNIIGSPMATATSIQIGISTEAIIEHKKVQEQYTKLKEEVDKVEKSIIFLNSKAREGKLPADKQIMLENLKKTRGPIATEFTIISKRFKELSEVMCNANDGIIKVKDVVHPGVKVAIGNSIKYINEKYSFCSIQKIGADISMGMY